MKRSKHSLSHYVLSTFDMGHLVPVGHFEVLPGDSVRMSTSALLRVSPLVTPVMHPVQVRIHHWFVPFRLLWSGWEDFITGGPDGLNATTPPVVSGDGSLDKVLWDYLGLPPGYTGSVNAWPVYAYNRIWNEFYRDQDLQNERADYQRHDLARVAWEKDYFTSARPWQQKGADVTVPMGTHAPVLAQATRHLTGAQEMVGVSDAATGARIASGTLGTNSTGQMAHNNSGINSTGGAYFDNLIADLSNAEAANINELRLAFALQRYQEARAQYGSRYTEYLRYLGVRSSDARLQRPEYLGGGKSTISFSEILRTGNESKATESPIGEMKGHGIAALRTRRFIRFFEEHGIVMSLASVRPRSMYTDGIHRSFLKKSKEDYYQKELEQIGQQGILQEEIYGETTNPGATFGYQDRYSEYRHHPSYVCSEFRDVMNDWHLARQFTADPALNASFVECNPSKRIHAEQTMNTIWGMFSHSIQARRLVGKRTIGRII